MEVGMSPPDTLRVKDDLAKHRAVINDLKQTYDVSAYAGGAMDATPMETPVTAVGLRAGTVRFAPVPEDTPADTAQPARTHQEIVQDVLLFANPAVSGLVLLAGTGFIAAVHYLLSASPLTFLSAASYLLLLDLAFNFVRSLVSRRAASAEGGAGGWVDSATARAVQERLVKAVDLACRAHDTFLSARSPVLSLKVAAALWALAMVGSYLSFWNVVTLAFVLAFTLPVGYQKYSAEVTAVWVKVSSGVQARWDALGLNRKQKFAVLGLALLMLWIRCSWATRMVAVLVGALAVRCHLKPAEVDYIMTHAEPYTQSVKKSARRWSIAATDFARRSLGTKTHFR